MRKRIISSLIFVSLISCSHLSVVKANDVLQFAFKDIVVGDYNRGAISYEITNRGIKYVPSTNHTSTDAYMRFEDFTSLGLVSATSNRYLAVRYRANFDPELIFRVKTTTGSQNWNEFYFNYSSGTYITNTIGTWNTYVFDLNYEYAKNITQANYDVWAQGDFKGVSVNIHNYNGLCESGAYLYLSSFAFFSSLNDAKSYGGFDYSSSLDTTGPVITIDEDVDTYRYSAGHPYSFIAHAYDAYDDLTVEITGVPSSGALDMNGKLVEGNHIVTFTATDLTGNVSTREVPLIVTSADTVAPVLNFDYDTIYVLTGTYNRLKFYATDDVDGEIACTYQYSDGALDELGRFNEGTHTLIVKATDLTGNVAQKEITIIASDNINPSGLELIEDEK